MNTQHASHVEAYDMDIQAFKEKAARAEERADAAEAAMMTNKKKKKPTKDNTMKSNLISS